MIIKTRHHHSHHHFISVAVIVGALDYFVICMSTALVTLYCKKESFGKDLNFVEA